LADTDPASEGVTTTVMSNVGAALASPDGMITIAATQLITARTCTLLRSARRMVTETPCATPLSAERWQW
jgi:hypothetical protein